MITHEPRLLTLYTDSWAVLKELILWLRQWEVRGWVIINKPLWGQGTQKDIWVHLLEPEAVFTHPCPSSEGADTPGNQETDALVQVRALATDSPVYTEDRIHRKSSYHSTWVG